MPVPDTDTFKLIADVVEEINPSMSPKGLNNCFSLADPAGFDPQYEGDKDRMLNFRNYHHTQAKYIGSEADGSVYAQGISWSTVRGLSSGTVNTASNPNRGYCFSENFDDALYTISRLFFKFDLNGIPSTVTLIEAYLKFVRWTTYNTQSGIDGYVAVLGTQGDTIDGSDYSNFSSTILLNGAISTELDVCSRPVVKLPATSGNLTTLENYLNDDLYMCIRHKYDYYDTEPATDEKLGAETYLSGVKVVPPYCFYNPYLFLKYTT